MNDDLLNLLELYDCVTQEIYADISVKNYYNRKWSSETQKKFTNIQDKGEILLQQIPNNSMYEEKLNKILNNLDSLWQVARKKGLL